MPQRDGPMGSGRHGMNPREKNAFPFRTDFMRIPAREEAPLSGSPRFRKMPSDRNLFPVLSDKVLSFTLLSKIKA